MKRVTDKPGELYVREAPCVCDNCLDEQWDECTVGGWIMKKMKVTGMQNPNAKHIEQQLKQLHGVHQVNIEIESNNGKIFIDFETPASLNNLEKEVYDLGYEILY